MIYLADATASGRVSVVRLLSLLRVLLLRGSCKRQFLCDLVVRGGIDAIKIGCGFP